jgi:hypothetical protein
MMDMKRLSMMKNSVVSAATGIGLSIANILKGHDFLEYALSIVGDMLSVVFDYNDQKSKKTKEVELK